MQDQTDITQRDDIIIFSQVLSKSNHNIKNLKNYRKIHHDLMKRTQAFPNSTEVTNERGYIWTIDNSQRNIQYESQQKMRINLNSLPMRRNSVTAGNSRRKKYENIKTHARTLNLSNNVSFREQSANTFKKKQSMQNKYAQIQKKHNKGPMKDKYLVCWLNSLLLQACQDQKFDTTLQNSALKKYGLDENSLRSKGIKPQNLTRIYKSLFVYSIGFNDLLKQICDENINLRKTIWKVFSILLQYCAQGDFQTVIAQIQRDKLQKIDNLTDQIMKRQKIIQNNEQINEKKNSKIFKQIKQLRDQNQNLLNEKQVLMQQFKQAQQAFNQEVALRLKYQNKINQIHGVYTQVQNKHLRLLHDHNQTVKQVEKLRTLSTKQGKQLIDLRKQNQHKTNDVQKLQKDLKYKFELVGQLQNRKHGDANINIENMNSIKDLKAVIDQKTRQITQLNLTINNINLIYQTEKLSHQQTSQALAASLQQNGRLHLTIQQQMRDLNSLLYDKRNFGMKTSEIQAQIALITDKLEEKTKQAKQQAAQKQKYIEQCRIAKTEVETQKKVRIQLEADLKICFDSIKDMKTAKNQIQDQNLERKRKMQVIDEIIAAKDAQIKQQKLLIQKQIEQISILKQDLMSIQSRNQLLDQKMKANEQIFNKKVQSLKIQRDTLQKQFLDFNSVKRSLQFQRDRFKSNFQQTDLNLKNQKFQRTNLKVYYDNSLNSNQQKNQEIKKLDIKISELNQTISNLKRKINSLEFVANEKQKQFQKQKSFWVERSQKLIHQNKQRKFYIHPMVHQDVCENFRIKSNYYQKLKINSTAKINELTKIITLKDQQIKSLKQSYQNSTQQTMLKYEAIIQKKTNQLLYEANKNSVLKQRNQQLQMNLRKYQGHNPQSSMQRQQRYLTDIKQKKQQIDVLLKDLEKAHDANRNLRQNYLKHQESIPKKQKQLAQIKQKMQQHKQKYEKMIKQKQKIIQQKVQQIKKFKQLQNQDIKKQNHDKIKSNRSKQAIRSTSGKKLQNSQQNRKNYEGSDSKRNDIARKIKGAVIYYAK